MIDLLVGSSLLEVMRIREITEYVRKYVHPDVDKQLKKYEKRATQIDYTEKCRNIQQSKHPHFDFELHQ